MKFSLLGKGLCRGPNWQKGPWPVDKGTKTRQVCANACKKRLGCVAFDLSPPEASEDKDDIAMGELQCNLFGHSDIIAASALKGNCYRLTGAEVVLEDASAPHAVDQEVKIVDDGSLDKLRSKGLQPSGVPTTFQ